MCEYGNAPATRLGLVDRWADQAMAR